MIWADFLGEWHTRAANNHRTYSIHPHHHHNKAELFPIDISLMFVWYDATQTEENTTRVLDSNDHLMHSDIGNTEKFQTQLLRIETVRPMVCARKVSFHSKSSLFSSANLSSVCVCSIQFPTPEFEISIGSSSTIETTLFVFFYCFLLNVQPISIVAYPPLYSM